MFGANLADLDGLKGLFETRASEVNQLTVTLNNRVQPGATAWQGPGADKFRTAWSSDFQPAMVKLESALNEAAQAVGKYRQNIEAATR
jgi:WXG100 family type VII secretion target